MQRAFYYEKMTAIWCELLVKYGLQGAYFKNSGRTFAEAACAGREGMYPGAMSVMSRTRMVRQSSHSVVKCIRDILMSEKQHWKGLECMENGRELCA